MSENRPARILVVDDSPALLFVVAALLESAGYEVTTAADASNLNELVGAGPDLVLLDVDLPGVSGDSAARELTCASGPMPYVLLFSGMSSEELEVLVENTGVDGYIYKNLPPEALLEDVARWVKRSQAGRGS